MAVKQKRKLKRPIKTLILLFLSGLFLVSAGVSFQFSTKNNKISEQVYDVTIKEPEIKEASLVMVGDALIHGAVYQDAQQSDGSYDFKPMIARIKPLVANFDLRYYNQETILGGASLGYSNYPRFNSPQEVGDAFLDAGFNLVSLATNHTMDKGEQGVINSVNYWKDKPAVTAGSYLSFEERDEEKIYEINGIKYAFFSYTTWTNGLETPTGKEYLNNVYSDELAKKNIEAVRDKVDVVIVAMHWGIEYSLGISSDQERIANYLSSLGVDIIIGAHPHVVEPIAYIGKTLVIYSLGNFISAQEGVERLTGLLASVKIRKVTNRGITTIALDSLKAELLYTYYNGAIRNFEVYPYTQLSNAVLPNYLTYYQRYKGVVQEFLGDQVEMPVLGG